MGTFAARYKHFIGICIYLQGKYDEAEGLCRSSLDTVHHIGYDGHPLEAQNLKTLVNILGKQVRFLCCSYNKGYNMRIHYGMLNETPCSYCSFFKDTIT